MTRKRHTALDDLRGASRLAVEATRSVTSLVQAMNVTIAAGPHLLGRPLLGPARFFTGPVYGSIRGVTRLVGSAIDRAFGHLAPLLAPLLGDRLPGLEREALIAAVNGVLGDHLEGSGNPLAIEMRLRHGGVPLALEKRALRAALPHVGGKLLVLVHGSCANDRQWLRLGHDHGAALAHDLGFTAVYLHYNSGLHISVNGRAFAELLEALVAAWPAPLEELVLVGHSMGGLVARSACAFGEAGDHAWRRKLGKLVCLGAPHHGAPLERGGHAIDLLLSMSRYSAPLARLGKIRSAGVTDLRFGYVRDEHWKGRDRFGRGGDVRARMRLPDGVQCYAIAATRTLHKASRRYASDGLVPVASALGRHREAGLTLRFPRAHQWIGLGMGHLDLLSRPEVYAVLRRWLAAPARRAAR